MDTSTRGNDGQSGKSVVLVYDAEFASAGRSLASKLGVKSLSLEQLRADDLLGADELIVDANLRSLQSVDLLKHVLDDETVTRTRVFLIADGELSRHWKVQANALGASLHVSRAAALAELRRRYSVVGRMALDARTEAELRQTRAGASIIEAGKSLAGLFSGVLGEDSFELADVSSAGVGVLKSVGTVGANEWLNTVREHHEGTFQHCLLVTGVAATYARQAGLSDVQAGALMNAALLHDIGKAVIPLHILDKPGKLSEEEFAVVKRHPSAAVLYLKSHVTVPPVVLDAVRHHHEYLDGSGYPDGLRGDQIRPLVRILTVCDIFAALVEQRAYKETKTPAQAVSILVDMTISSKLDYGAVRILAEAFGVKLPETFEDVVRNLVRPRTG